VSGFAVTPVLGAVYAALVPFIATVTGLPAANIVLGIPNRAAMPSPGFISIQALHRHRLRTNIHGPVAVGAPGQPGTLNIEEGVELTLQIDCYSEPVADAAAQTAEDWATMLSATLRDEYGCDQLAPTVTPLFADDAQMIPLVAGEEQYEERWALEARFQYDPVTTIPQESAAALKLELIDVPNLTPT
jgi:hypothetical protein